MPIITTTGMILCSDRRGTDGAAGTGGAGALIPIGLICRDGIIRGMIRGDRHGDGIPVGTRVGIARLIISPVIVWQATGYIAAAMAA